MDNDLGLVCEWFALCDHTTDKAVDHPVAGITMICDRCAERMEIEPEYRLDRVKGHLVWQEL